MSCADFIARSFAIRTAAHLAHLQSRSYAEHIALNEFYDRVLGLVDTFAETYQGMFAVVTSYPALTPPTGAPLVFLVDYLDWVKQNYASCTRGETALGAILDEVMSTTAQTIYKLRNLK